MSGFKVNFSVNNQLATPSIHAAPFAQRPAAGQPGRVFIDTDNPSTGIYRDTGSVWVQIAETATSDVDTLQNVTDNGNTTTNSITVGAATVPVGTIDVRRSTAALNGANDWALVSVNSPTIASGASFGVNYVNALYGSQNLTFSGNATIGNTGINAAGNFINSLGNNASGTITVTQGSGTIRAIAGVQAGIYYNTPNAMTFTHVAGIKTLQPINSGAVGASVTNYYGVQIADSTPSSGTISYTNRYGIYQEGASDVNYFAGNVGIGTTSSIYKLDVRGTIYTNNALWMNDGVSASSSYISSPAGYGGTATRIGENGNGRDLTIVPNEGNARAAIYAALPIWFRQDVFMFNKSFTIWNGSFATIFSASPTTGNCLIGTGTDAGYKLDVNGTVRVQGTELRLDNGTTGVINLYSATPSIQFSSSDPTGYRLYRSGTTMYLNGANIKLQIQGNDGYQLDATFGHIWRTALSGAAVLARLDTGGSLSIGNGVTAANASSILDLTSTTKGFLPPRMTTAQVNAIAAPPNGLLVYNTTIDHFCGYQAGAWVKFSHSPM